MDTDTLTPFDFEVRHHGSIAILSPQNDEARSWIEDNVYSVNDGQVQWWGDGIVVEPRYLDELLAGVASDGLTIAGLA